MKERRRTPRYTVQDVRGLAVFAVEAQLVNLSLTGAALELASPIRVGGQYLLKLASAGSRVRLPGTVVWCQPAPARLDEVGEEVAVHHAGLRFHDVLGPKGEELLDVFRHSVVLSFGQRLSARFRLETPRQVGLLAEHDFEVRKISASGMLIETDLETELDSILEMELQLDGSTLPLRGRVACIIADSGVGEGPQRPARYRLGVEFQEVSDRDRAALEQFLAQQVVAG